VDLAEDAEAIAQRLTQAGLEVDEVTHLGTGLEGVVVAEVVQVEPHPDADRLRVCQVNFGSDRPCTIVCGAPNVRAGMKAALATPGTVLPNGLKIKASKLRGVRSEGMLCSAIELGLGEDSGGLIELPEDWLVGQALREAMQLEDWVIALDLTPNRADCLSVRGLARELAALTDCPVQAPDMPPVPAKSKAIMSVTVAAPEDCPVYLSRVIEAVDVKAPSPTWLTERLRRSGLRSLGAIVDVTNYVLLELGQPLHAFDRARIEGDIVIRRAQAGERMTLLDEREVSLDEHMLVIADTAAQPIALAGIMGGLDSAVGDQTQSIVLESAWFDPRAIAGRARRLGLATESAHRFERGVDSALQQAAIERATQLIIDIAGGQPGPVNAVRHDHPALNPVAIVLRPERVNHLLGTALPATEMQHILQRLHMHVDSVDAGLLITPPSARPDLLEEVDLIEEIARLVGYDALPVHRPNGQLATAAASELVLEERSLRQQLVARGWHEAITWSFVSLQQLQQLGLAEGAWPLANPLNQDMAWLRTSLLPGLLASAQRNQRMGHSDVRLIEVGTVFNRVDDQLVESRRIGFLMMGARQQEHFDADAAAVDFYDLKGEIEALIERNQLAGSFQVSAVAVPQWLHPGQGARCQLAGRDCGWLGQLHPALTEALDLQGPVWVAELDLLALGARRLPAHTRSSKFPAVRRDLSLLVPEALTAAELLDAVRRSAGGSLTRTVIFDLYRGKGVEKGWKSVGLGLIFREVSRTLTDQDVDDQVQAVLSVLKNDHQIALRG
jgi:phenylalanyl-tRNA synthetase beta chain